MNKRAIRNGDERIFPPTGLLGGLTKRELIAAILMGTTIRDPDGFLKNAESAADSAIRYTDALLEMLQKPRANV